MDKETYEKFSLFFGEAPTVQNGIRTLVTKACDVVGERNPEDILNSVRHVVDLVDEYLTTDPLSYGDPDSLFSDATG